MNRAPLTITRHSQDDTISIVTSDGTQSLHHCDKKRFRLLVAYFAANSPSSHLTHVFMTILSDWDEETQGGDS